MSSVMNASSPAHVSPHHIQQRQILAMMGIEVWVARHAKTACIAQVQDTFHELDNPSSVQPVQPVDTTPDKTVDSIANTANDPVTDAPPSQKQPSPAQPTHNMDAVSQPVVTSEVGRAMPSVSAFTMIGASFHNWVVMVTSDDLKQTAHAKLWQNICTALSLQVEQLSFPICEGINDLDSANATLAGFVFRVSQKDAVNLAVLSPLPKGVVYRHRHAQPPAVPSLAQMLADPLQKQRFWQILTATSKS